MIDRKRWTVRLGAINNRQAEAIQQKVEALVAARVTGMPTDAETSRWLSTIDAKLHERLARTGLVASWETTKAHTLGDLLAEFFANLAVKPGTAATYAQARRSLEDHFGKDRPLSSITNLEAARWRQALKDEELAEPTISKRVKVARQVFKAGRQWGMVVGDNPFTGVKAGVQTNKSRMFFITQEDARKVLDACPDAEWRLLFALSRFGGLRCPSEHLALRWRDINWARGRMTVWSCKTEGHAGQESRTVPLFKELRPIMQEAFELAEDGAEFVITRYRDPSCNLRTQLHRILKRAGVKPWPKVFHNLRSTRQTELTEIFPTHVVCAWLGNSTVVAHGHYLQVRDQHFDMAAGVAVKSEPMRVA